MIEKLKEWKGVAVFMLVVVIVALWLWNSGAQQQGTEHRQQEILTALAHQNYEAIKANGEFQSCIWLSIIKPDVVGHEDRAVWAIKKCERKYLGGEHATETT